MKISHRDLVKLRAPLLAAIVLIGMAILFATWTAGIAHQAALERDATAGRKHRIEQRLLQVRSEEQEIKERTTLFQQLEKSGLIGDEKRLDWIEQLRDLQRQLQLPGMSYEFGPQAPLEKTIGTGDAYFGSPLKIALRLLHEEDLLAFIGRLQKEAKALVVVRSCRLSRLPGQDASGGPPAFLEAECEMDWITLRRVGGGSLP